MADFESADLSQREFAQEQLSLSNLRYRIFRLHKESRSLRMARAAAAPP